MTTNTNSPVFICGHPRAGSTALYEYLRQHPEFYNEKYFDKEAKFFQQIIENRPWGTVPTLNPKHLSRNIEVDHVFVRRGVRMVHELLREYMGGPNGRYLLAYPYDVFNIPYILEADPSSKFIAILREPISNVWSMLNYPKSPDWHPNSRPEEGYYDKKDIWDNFLRWSQPYWTLAKLKQSPAYSAIKIVRYEDLITDTRQTMINMFDFIEAEPVEDIIERMTHNTHHSSFQKDAEVDGSVESGQRPRRADLAHKRNSDALRHPEILKACAHYLELAKMPLSELGFDYKIPDVAYDDQANG